MGIFIGRFIFSLHLTSCPGRTALCYIAAFCSPIWQKKKLHFLKSLGWSQNGTEHIECIDLNGNALAPVSGAQAERIWRIIGVTITT